jgi:hypothetical protein
MENAEITYSYDIYYLNVAPHENGLTNVVKEVNWRYQIKQDSYYADEYILTSLQSSDPNKFIAYDDLTDETVFSWIESSEDLIKLREKLKVKLEENKNPKIVEKEIPWTKQEMYTGEEEYLIVFDDDVEKIWGPTRWDSQRANAGLKHFDVQDYVFPVNITMYQKELLPIGEPKIINDRVKLYRVEYTERPDFDKLTQYNEGLSWVLDSGKAIGTYFVHDRPIDDIRQTLIEQVIFKGIEKAKQNLIEFAVDGITYLFDSSIESRVQLFLVPETATDSVFVTGDREYLTLTKEQLDQLSGLIHQHHQDILDWENQKVQQIRAAETAEELKALEI